MDAQGWGLGIALTAFLFGLRHGFDVDHLVAIADISGAQDDKRRSLMLSFLYAAGHAVIVFVLGALAIVAGAYIPAAVDDAMSRVIGITLIVLGIYLVVSVVRHGSNFRMRSRWMLVLGALRDLIARVRKPKTIVIEHDHEHTHDASHAHSHMDPSVTEAAGPRGAVATATRTHRHTHRHVAAIPADPFVTYGPATAVGIGMLHGVGAETPTQILLLATAAGVGDAALGVALLALFVAGLLVANTAVSVASSVGFLNGARNPRAYVALAVVTAVFSIGLGVSYLL